MNNDVTIENRPQFIADFHENVPFQSDEDAEDQLQWMAICAYAYSYLRIRKRRSKQPTCRKFRNELLARHFGARRKWVYRTLSNVNGSL